MTTSRIQQLRIRLAGKALGGVPELMLPKVQTEMSGVLYKISGYLEDGEVSASERTSAIAALTELRDDINAVLEVLENTAISLITITGSAHVSCSRCGAPAHPYETCNEHAVQDAMDRLSKEVDAAKKELCDIHADRQTLLNTFQVVNVENERRRQLLAEIWAKEFSLTEGLKKRLCDELGKECP